MIAQEDFKYRVKLTLKVGEIVEPDGKISEVFTTETNRGVFTIIENAVRSLKEHVNANSDVTVGHIQIKGSLTNGNWERIVYAKQGENRLKPCVALKEEIWSLFKPFAETNVVQ